MSDLVHSLHAGKVRAHETVEKQAIMLKTQCQGCLTSTPRPTARWKGPVLARMTFNSNMGRVDHTRERMHEKGGL
jgi:hypothetical protein